MFIKFLRPTEGRSKKRCTPSDYQLGITFTLLRTPEIIPNFLFLRAVEDKGTRDNTRV